MTGRRHLAAAAIAALLLPAAAAARELHWRGLTVDARLEDDGTLTVSERHDMVFTGDWNGGERNFNIRLGHRLQLDGVYRLDGAAGTWRRMEEGSLDEIDHWQWTDSDTVRWRSRLPSDPEFDATEISYRLDYRLLGILGRDGARWWLDHDFAFPDRDGTIERFSLDLELGPLWRATGRPQLHVEEGPLPPGASYVLRTALAYLGDTPPANAQPHRLSDIQRGGALAVALLGALAVWVWAVRRERASGRLARLPGLDGIDRPWIEQHLLSLAPEEVGATWDDTIAAPEVTAILARMQLEGKLASRVEEKRVLFLRTQNLHLSLLVSRDSLTATERLLIDSLFPLGDQIDTESLKRHYQSSGLDPAGKIRAVLERQLDRNPELAGKRLHPPRLSSFVLIGAGVALLALAIALSTRDTAGPVLLTGALVVGWLPAFIGACVLRNRVTRFAGPTVAIVVGQLLGLAALAALSAVPYLSLAALAGGVLFHLGLTRTAATTVQTRQPVQRIARRRELARARNWLAAELARPKPQLDDSWLPYLIAFGLAPQMDRWFKAHGTARGTAVSGTSWSGGGSAAGSGGGSWTGGGGSFGGGGATASWAAAAGTLSAGVSSASSSSGGGGGGGGGSSGGGGGGGW